MNAIILQKKKKKNRSPINRNTKSRVGKETTGQLQDSTSAWCDGRLLGILNTFSGACGGQNHFPVILRMLFGSSAPLMPALAIQKQCGGSGGWRAAGIKMLAPQQELSSYSKLS